MIKTKMPKKITSSIEYFAGFRKLWKTTKSLKLWYDETSEQQKDIMFDIIKYYYPKTKKKQTAVTWRDIADRVFSEYIRIINADEYGYCTCITCSARYKRDSEDMQCGHYRTRAHLYSRFLESNSHPQCYKCNCIKNGNYRNYYIFMKKKYGKELEDFLWKNNKITKFYDSDYITMIYDWYHVIVSI